MIALLATLVLADQILFVPDAPPDRHALAARFSSECATSSSADCKSMQWQLEQILYEDIRAKAATNHATWHLAAGADHPQLAKIGLINIRDGFSKDDEAVVLPQLDSPFPTVRVAAWDLVSKLSDPKWAAMNIRRAHEETTKFPVADTIPSNERLGGAPYPGATFRYFASGKDRAFFTTGDSPEKVIAFYAKGNRKGLTMDEFKADQKKRKAAQEAVQKDPMAMAMKMQAAMAAGKDPQSVMQEMQAGMTDSQDWTKGLAQEKGVTAPKLVPLDDAMQQVVLVFKDDLMGSTAAVFLHVLSADDLAVKKMMAAQMSGKKGDKTQDKLMNQRVNAQVWLGKPLIPDTVKDSNGGDDQ